jgi:predicted Rossmann-fold nucleotide-binding protein
MSAHGVSEIPRGQTDRFMAQNTLAAARSFGIGRSIPEHLKDLTPFIEALKPAGDRSRVAILDRILAEDIPGIAKSGDVRAFLLRDFGPLAMTKEIHNVLVDVVRTGVAIEWANGERRKFHRSGLWMKPEQVDRMEELDLVFAMYGTHKDAIDKRLKPQIQDFLAGMTDLVPAYNLGVTHGNGPGVMRIADEVARAYGIMSLGVGIDVEALGQGKANLLPEGVAIFKASERLYRQEMLDKLNTISIFNVGGFGTLEEASITLCTHKLLSRLSAPSILVDPDNLYRHVKAQFDEISNRKTITIGGEVVDLSNSPLGQAWVSNTIHRVKDYDEAQTIVQDYWNNPADYWERAGLSKQDVAMGLQNHMEVAARLGMRLAYNLTTAAKAFISN